MCYNRRSLVVYDIVVLLIIILLVSMMMNGCGFSYWSYQVFHLPYVAAMSVDLTIPILFSKRDQALLPSALGGLSIIAPSTRRLRKRLI